MTKSKKRFSSILLLLITLVSIILSILSSQVNAETYTIEYLGKATYGLSTVGNFRVNGRQAFCTDHKKSTPPSGTIVESSLYENDNIAKCLYYGWGGENQWNFSSEAQGIVYTSLALDHYKNGNANNTAKTFIEYIDSMPVPQIVLSFSENSLNAFLADNIQRTQSIVVNGPSKYYLTIQLQEGVTLVNETRGTEQAGNVNVYGGEQFYLKAPLIVNGSWTSNNIDNHKYRFQPIIYKTSNNSYQELTSGYQVIPETTSTINLSVNWLSMGKIQIHKKDVETGEAISNTTFEVKNQDGMVVTKITTDLNGFAEVSNLIAGTYTLVEVSTDDNYILNNQPQEVTILAGETKLIEITNKHTEGDLKIMKVDSKDKKTPIEGVTFDVWNLELNKKVATATTDKDGIIEINNLRTGKYKIVETKANKWYNLCEDKVIIIEANKITKVAIENELKEGQIKVVKVDLDNNKIKLAGVKFEVLDENNNVLETIITDENGEATTQKYAIKNYSKLTIREKETLQNYVLNDTPQTVTLEENQIKTVVFKNELKKGQIKVIKVSKEDNQYNGKVKGSRIANAKFEVYDEYNNLVDTLITDENGEAITKELLKGKYTLKEIESPDYYILTDEAFSVEIVDHHEIIEVKVEDDNVDIDVEVTKRGFTETQSKDSIYYDFTNIHNKSNIPLNNFTWSDSLPTNALRANRIYTGTWNEELTYSVWYKTNLSDDYIMLTDDLSTSVNNEVKFTDVILQDGEFITDFEFRFGTVKADFKEIQQPRLYCDMLSNLPNGFTFVNHTRVSGNYKDIYAEDTDDWKTIIQYPMEKLPRTGGTDYLSYVIKGMIIMSYIVIVFVLQKNLIENKRF